MMNSIAKAFVVVALFTLDFVVGGSLRAERRTGEVYSISSKVKWTVFTPNPSLFSTTEMYYLQQSASSFFEERIKESPQFDLQNIIRVDFQVKDQTIDTSAVQSTLMAEITMTYGGKVVNNFSDLLPSVVDNNQVEDLVTIFIRNGFYEETSTSANIKYQPDGYSELLADDEFTTYMIIFIVILTVSSVLALSAVIILCSSKCCNRHRGWRSDQRNELKLTITEESDEPPRPDSPPAVLGAQVQSNRRDVVITPQRGIHHEFEETPMSQDTNFTEAKTIYSTTSSKAPLGILSMNKLSKIMHSSSPQRQSKNIALYDVGLDDDEGDYDGDSATVHENNNER